MNYYNEFDPFAAEWLQRLINAGAIPNGYIDTRSIADVSPSDLTGFNQCHFFAGIGGWSHALSLAGVPSNMPLWTGSCPCQPFSNAGKRRGTEDERHLWPVWERLIAQCRPAICFGEQIASDTGRTWLSNVRTDLEALGYAVGGADLCAAGVGAPHIRQRLWFVGLGDTNIHQFWRDRLQQVRGERNAGRQDSSSPGSSAACGLADTDNEGSQGRGGMPECADQLAPREGGMENGMDDRGRSGTHHSFWSDADWLFCRDSKWRQVEPGSQPLGTRLSNRVGRLRGYGNSICPQVAEAFIRAALNL